jgi:hypothetical protein
MPEPPGADPDSVRAIGCCQKPRTIKKTRDTGHDPNPDGEIGNFYFLDFKAAAKNSNRQQNRTENE